MFGFMYHIALNCCTLCLIPFFHLLFYKFAISIWISKELRIKTDVIFTWPKHHCTNYRNKTCMAMYFNQTITFCMFNFYIDHIVSLPCIIKGHSFEWPDLYYLYCECYSNRLFKAFSKSAFVFLKISISLSVNFIPSLILILPGQKVTFFSISFGKKNSTLATPPFFIY